MNPTLEMRIMGISAFERRVYRRLRTVMDRDSANLAMVGFMLFDRIDVAVYGATFRSRYVQLALENLEAQNI